MSHPQILIKAFASHGLVFPLDIYFYHILPYTLKIDPKKQYKLALVEFLQGCEFCRKYQIKEPRGFLTAHNRYALLPVIMEGRAKNWPVRHFCCVNPLGDVVSQMRGVFGVLGQATETSLVLPTEIKDLLYRGKKRRLNP